MPVSGSTSTSTIWVANALPGPAGSRFALPTTGASRLGEALCHVLEADAQLGVGLVAESAVGEADLVNIGFPHEGGALDHLALDILGGFEACQPVLNAAPLPPVMDV